MGLLGRDQLLQKEDLKIEKVEFDDGNFVYVKEMTGREKDSFEKTLIKVIKDKKGKVVDFEQITDDFRSKLAVCTVCDEDGKLLLRTEDWATLSTNIGALKLEKIVNTAQRLNAITEEDKEELVKNSGAVPDGNSSSDSVEN